MVDEQPKRDNKKGILIIVAVMLALIVGVFAVSYAFFTNVIRTEGDTSVIVRASDIRIVFNNQNVILVEDFMPGDETELKTFTVENVSNKEFYYAIEWIEVLNTFERIEDLEYELMIKVGEEWETVARNTAPTEDAFMQEGILINANETHTYALKIVYLSYDRDLYPDEDQTVDMGAEFFGKINIIPSKPEEILP